MLEARIHNYNLSIIMTDKVTAHSSLRAMYLEKLYIINIILSIMIL